MDSIPQPFLPQSETHGYPLALSSLIYAVRAFERSKIYTEDADAFRKFAKAQFETDQYERALREITEASLPAQEQWQDRSQPPPMDNHDYAHECLIEAGREMHRAAMASPPDRRTYEAFKVVLKEMCTREAEAADGELDDHVLATEDMLTAILRLIEGNE